MASGASLSETASGADFGGSRTYTNSYDVLGKEVKPARKEYGSPAAMRKLAL